jgi:hypothetical protein
LNCKHPKYFLYLILPSHERPATRYEIIPRLNFLRRDTNSAKRAGIHNQIPKKIKKFSDSLTPFPTRSYLFSAFSETSVANAIFVPNAQVRPFIERLFSRPELACGELARGELVEPVEPVEGSAPPDIV